MVMTGATAPRANALALVKKTTWWAFFYRVSGAFWTRSRGPVTDVTDPRPAIRGQAESLGIYRCSAALTHAVTGQPVKQDVQIARHHQQQEGELEIHVFFQVHEELRNHRAAGDGHDQ
jgi:hypothetical protein